MRKGTDIIGKAVVAYDSGEKFETVLDLVFDQNSNRLLGFLVDEAGWFSSSKVIALQSVQAIGPDAIIVPSKSAEVPASQIQPIDRVLEHNNIMKGTKIMSTDGRNLGTMIDLYFDEVTGDIEGYEVSGGIFADAYSGRSFVPAPETLKIGKDVAFVPSETADMMQEQVGGIKAAMQTAGDKLRETADTTGEKLQAAGQSVAAGLAVDRAQGRRVARSVYTPDGFIVAAAGQIVTPQVIDRAKTYHQEPALLEAVGLSTGDAVKGSASETGQQLKEKTLDATEQIRTGAKGLWEQVKETTSELQERGTQAVEEKRIKGALGRAVVRVILGTNDEVILNVGDLITHQSIAAARQAGVLDILLDSVYTETPHLSVDDLRAPEPPSKPPLAQAPGTPNPPQIILDDRRMPESNSTNRPIN
jgi:uncharacterized protein YrrD